MHVQSLSTIVLAFTFFSHSYLPSSLSVAVFQLKPKNFENQLYPSFTQRNSHLYHNMNHLGDSKQDERKNHDEKYPISSKCEESKEENDWIPASTRKRRPRRHHHQASTNESNFTSTSKNSTNMVNNNKVNPFVLLLVGIPGSGKSTFAKTLQQLAPHKYVRINQDALGNRKKCEALMRKTLRENKCPIIDRCNFNKQQRDYFWNIAMEERHTNIIRKDEVIQVQGVECIVFQCSVNVCINRCEGRGDSHETIKPGMARKVVGRMKKDLVVPDSNERKWKKLRFVKNYNIDDMKKLIKNYL